MEIIVGKTAGFCPGVRNAINMSLEELKKHKKVYCLGELVHNKQVTEELEEKGMVFVDSLDDAKDRIIIRAHGIPLEYYKDAENKGIKLVDLTCPKVSNIHKLVYKYALDGYFIFLVGDEKHPETIGTAGFCLEHFCTVKNIGEVDIALKLFELSKKDNALIISQTTYDVEKFKEIVLKTKKEINEEHLVVHNTICEATRKRQEETKRLAGEVELMIIIGGKHSSNSNKLYDISNENCKNSIFIETKDEIDIDFIKKFNKIGIMAGASTPDKSVHEVVEIIKKL